MKKLGLILAVSMGLMACAEKDSEYARKYRTQGGAQAETTTAEAPAAKSVEICQEPVKRVCSVQESPVAISLKTEGRKQALNELRKELNLPEDFDGSEEAFKEFFKEREADRYKAQKRFLVLADKAYRSIYDYDADLSEATGIAIDALIKIVEKENLDSDKRLGLIGALNLSVVQSISTTFENEYPGKSEVTMTVEMACGSDGLGLGAHSMLPGGGPNGVIVICPGVLIKNAGKSKQERIASLVSILGHELSHQLQFRGLAPDQKTLSCLESAETDSSKKAEFAREHDQETLADVYGFKVLNAYLSSEKDIKVRTEKAVLALSWICDVNDSELNENSKYLNKATRIENYFKLNETGEQLSCSGGPRC